MRRTWIAALILSTFVWTALCQTAARAVESHTPQSLEFLPPPPAENSPDFARDKALYHIGHAAKGTERWELAAFDADIRANAGAWFKDAFGMVITPEHTPATYELLFSLARRLHDAGASAKAHYMRKRPYMYFDAAGSTCAPQDEEKLRTNGSYPSGHTALGWGMALVLAELSPERQSALLRRGHEIGQSRVICGVHWQSDVDAGRLVASATVAQLHNDAVFTAMLANARDEVARLRVQAK